MSARLSKCVSSYTPGEGWGPAGVKDGAVGGPYGHENETKSIPYDCQTYP